MIAPTLIFLATNRSKRILSGKMLKFNSISLKIQKNQAKCDVKNMATKVKKVL